MRRRLKLPYFLVLLGTFFALLILPLLLNAGTPSAKEEIKTTYSKQVFVNTLAKEVRPIAKAYGIRPSLVIGQALLESHYGQTLLSAKYNNLFARQASVGQVFVTLTTDSPKEGKMSFAVYRDREASIRDYLALLSEGKAIDKHLYRILATEKGYKVPAKALEDYLYPEELGYANKLIRLIESEQLTKYD